MANDKDNKDTTNVDPAAKDPATDLLNERLDAIENGLKADLEESKSQVADLTEALKKANKSNSRDSDEVVDTERRSAHIMELPVIDGSPIVKSSISGVLGIKGIEMIASVETADGKKYDVPFGCDVKQVDFQTEATENLYKISYENLSSEKFELEDIDPNDLTGASKVEKGQIVSEGGLIPEVDRSTGTPVATGRKIRPKVRKDVRHYTIKHNGKKITFTNEDLANIRI